MAATACIALITLLVAQSHAFTFFQGTNPMITQDIIWLLSNSSSLDDINSDVPPITYQDSINPIANLSEPSSYGLKGVLYDRGDSCSMKPTNAVPAPWPNMTSPALMALPRIALIVDGQCSLPEKLWFAQADGANACIVFASDARTMNLPQSMPANASITIPTFYVKSAVGQQLLTQVHQMQQQTDTLVSSTVSAKQVVRVLMLPATSARPNPWEITLLIMIVILSIGFLASVSMHLYLWRRNRRLQRLVDEGVLPAPPDMLPMGKALLKEQKLDLFPKTTVTQELIDSHRHVPTSSSTVSNSQKQLECVERQQDVDSGHGGNDDDDDEHYTCVICLEPMVVDQTIRQLPCNHDYHCTCIDPWLTTKSGECPLCKFNCVRHVMTSEEHEAMERAKAIFEESNPSLWRWLKRRVWARVRNRSETDARPSSSSNDVELADASS
ncbi:hypothetical protein BC940DRAFT_333088 [Gongronella butleri]|nr:hypothetical protein BC940DRAFT_333088 [Gongronella butleri]